MLAHLSIVTRGDFNLIAEIPMANLMDYIWLKIFKMNESPFGECFSQVIRSEIMALEQPR